MWQIFVASKFHSTRSRSSLILNFNIRNLTSRFRYRVDLVISLFRYFDTHFQYKILCYNSAVCTTNHHPFFFYTTHSNTLQTHVSSPQHRAATFFCVFCHHLCLFPSHLVSFSFDHRCENWNPPHHLSLHHSHHCCLL